MVTGIDVVERNLGYRHVAPVLEVRKMAPVLLDQGHLAASGICSLDPLDPRARSFALLRSQIMNGFHASGGRIMAITSTRPGNGKSFVAANLAFALSRVQPVVLIDLDLAKPVLADRLGLAPLAGIDDFLLDGAPLDFCGQRIENMRLTVYPVRQPRLDTGAALASERLDAMLRGLADQEADPIFVIDTPPTLAIEETLSIAAKVQGMLIVVEEGETPADELKEAIDLVEPTPIIGTVLNKSIASLFRRRHQYQYYADRSLLPPKSRP
ncbi:CpsD/CapB family tyrosine-protein kinase [Sphingobium bisphenolivorans]|uniref:CpsD/CapB family tyrosine-protein kinase n=1 Tax=Sphingobium bisphenolivorans TaxID=1335760 RepID=UPI0003A0C541|nr:CpsD/CapB family tyrosine-protein kinase [Sphingobium bisphenolivorans]